MSTLSLAETNGRPRVRAAFDLLHGAGVAHMDVAPWHVRHSGQSDDPSLRIIDFDQAFADAPPSVFESENAQLRRVLGQ